MSTKPQPPVDDDLLNPKIAASALDFLLIELVPLAQRLTEQLLARDQALRDEYKRSRLFNQTASRAPAGTASQTQTQQSRSQDGAESAGGGGGGVSGKDVSGGDAPQRSSMTSLGFPAMDEATREGVFWRLDGLGYRVGQGLVER